jgi:hypothetical protein
MSTNPPENAVEVASHDLFGWRDLARECDRLRDALRAIIGCGLNCKDALDEAEQMERIAKEALSPENAITEGPAA